MDEHSEPSTDAEQALDDNISVKAKLHIISAMPLKSSGILKRPEAEPEPTPTESVHSQHAQQKMARDRGSSGDDVSMQDGDDVVRQKSRSRSITILRKITVVLYSAVAFSVVITLMGIIPLAMVIVGAIYMHECRRQPYIPIYLLVAGVAGLIESANVLIRHALNTHMMRRKPDTKMADLHHTKCLDTIVNGFLLIWFICGNVWIYEMHDDFDPTNRSVARYCHPMLYGFAFWLTTCAYITLTFIVLSVGGAGTLITCFKRKSLPDINVRLTGP